MRVKYRHGKLVIWGEKGMKVRQIVRIILVVIVLVIVGIFIRERMHGLLHEMEEGGVTVGESADGPTSAFFAGKLGGDNEEVEDMSQDEKAELKLIIADMEVEVLWEENAAVDELKLAVADETMTIEMSMYGGFEQVGSLGRSFTSEDEQTTTGAGDIVLYNGNQLVVFYGSNSWAYTRLGKIQNLSEQELTELLSNGDVTMTIYE